MLEIILFPGHTATAGVKKLDLAEPEENRLPLFTKLVYLV